MKTLLLCVAALPLALLVPSQEQGVPRPIEPLAAFAPLVGPTWVAGMTGGQMSDTQRFEWVFGGRFLRNTHEVRGPAEVLMYAGETIYAWDARSEQVVWWYWNSTGGYVTGTLEDQGEGRFLAVGENHAPPNQPRRVKTELKLEDGAWSSAGYFERDGAWQPQQQLRFRAVE